MRRGEIIIISFVRETDHNTDVIIILREIYIDKSRVKIESLKSKLSRVASIYEAI